MYLFCIMIHYVKDHIFSFRHRQGTDKVNSNELPRSLWYFMRDDLRFRVYVLSIALTFIASFNILGYETSHARPPIVTTDELDCTVLSSVSGGKGVVTSPYYVASKFPYIWNVEF